MKTLEEWIDWYWSKRVYVYPFDNPTESFSWSYWKNIKDADYTSLIDNYKKIDAIGLNIVTGKKGICGIGLRRDNNERHSLSILKETLQLLSLPDDYLWVLKTPHEYIVIVDIRNGFNRQDLKNFGYVRILWETNIKLPSIKKDDPYPVQFANYFYPQAHPIQIRKDNVYSAIDTIKGKVILTETEMNGSWFKRFLKLFK